MDIFLIKLFLAVLFISIVSSLTGTFTFLQKKALISDALSHSVLPGIVLGFILSGHLNPWLVLTGAMVSGWLSLKLIDLLKKISPLKSDALLAVSLSTFLAVGLSLISFTQLNPAYSRSGLTDFLFGKITAINNNDLFMMGTVCAATLLVIILCWNTLVMRSFDESYAKSRGFRVRLLDTIFNLLIITTVAISVQAIGVVLTSALLIVPVAFARMFSYKVYKIALIALAVSLFSTLSGTTISIYMENIPTGPAMVVMLSITFAFGILFNYLKPAKNG
jgi:manganese/zinc/iron transport system permease protein